jgi:hypothetical protein
MTWSGDLRIAAVLTGALGSSPLLTRIGADVRGDDFGRGVLGGVDVDGDEVPDVLVLDGARNGPESVWVISGRTGAVLRRDAGRTLGKETRYEARTFAISWVGDVDHDGMSDYAYDLGRYDVGGRVHIRSTRTGERLWSFPEDEKDGSWSMSVAALGDIDADGAVDFACGMPFDSRGGKRAGRCAVVSGKSRKTLFEVEGRVPEAQFGRVRALGDLDADGVHEFVVWGKHGQDGQEALGIYRGKGGERIGWLQVAAGRGLRPNGVQSGFDWNDDGFDDVFVGCSGCRVGPRPCEEIHVFSVKDRTELAVFPERVSASGIDYLAHFGSASTCLRGVQPSPSLVLVVGAYDEMPFGEVRVFGSKTGDEPLAGLRASLTQFDIPDEILDLESMLHIGGALANAGDLDRDRTDDLLVACTTYCQPQRGIVWALSGRTGKQLFRWHRRSGVEEPIVKVEGTATTPK